MSMQPVAVFNYITLLPGQLIQPMIEQALSRDTGIFIFRIPAMLIRNGIKDWAA